jgi:MFS family permease
MPSVPAHAASAPAPAGSGRLPATVAFYLLVSIMVFFLAGSSAPTPLYAVYQAAWGFSPITTTIVFGVYALAVLAALLTVGSLSDYVGRRPVLLVAIVLQAVVMLVFATAGGVPQLLVARILQGLSTGAAAGAVGAALVDLHKARGTIANAVGPATGTATGAIGSGLLAQYLPDPTHLVYLVLFLVFALQALGVLLMAETSTSRPGALGSMRPRFALPAATRRPFLVAIPALVAAWSLAGLYGSLGPALVRPLVGANSLVLAGLALFDLAGSGALTVLLLRTAAPRTVLVLGGPSCPCGSGTAAPSQAPHPLMGPQARAFRQRGYRNDSCKRASSAAPGHNCSYGTCASGTADVLFVSCRSPPDSSR